MKAFWIFFLAGLTAACATSVAEGDSPYLAHYQPITASAGEVIVYPTAALDGRLAVVDGCFVVISDSGTATLVAFSAQVSTVRGGGRWGLRDAQHGERVFEGELIQIGGASAADAAGFIQ